MLLGYSGEGYLCELYLDENVTARSEAESQFWIERFELMRNDMNDIKSAVKDMAVAMTRLAVLEEKHFVTTSIAKETLDRVEKLESRVIELEKYRLAQEVRVGTVSIAVKMLWAVFGGGVTIATYKILVFLI